jgi:hypothetical protein
MDPADGEGITRGRVHKLRRADRRSWHRGVVPFLATSIGTADLVTNKTLGSQVVRFLCKWQGVGKELLHLA